MKNKIHNINVVAKEKLQEHARRNKFPAHTFAQTPARADETERQRQEIDWLKEQIEVSAKQLEVCAAAHERDQLLMLELQAEKKTFYDETQKLKNQLSAPRIKLPKFLSFLRTN